MSTVFLLFAIGSLILHVVNSERSRRKGRLQLFRQAARRVGLAGVEEAPDRLFQRPWLSGRWGPLRVGLEEHRNQQKGTHIAVDGFGHGADGLTLRLAGPGRALRRILRSGDLELGAPAFDEDLQVQGRGPVAFAVLDAETRRRVAGLLQGSIPVRGRGPVEVTAALGGDTLSVWLKDSDEMTGEHFDHVLGEVLVSVLELAQRLVAPKDLAGRIAENLRGEPAEGVRLQGLLLLVRELPDHPATREALRAACKDHSPELRLRAAAALGEEGRETLLALADGEATDDGYAARALAALGARGAGLSAALLEVALHGPLALGLSRTALICLEALGRRGRPASEGLLLEALGSGDPQVAVAAARALGQVGTAAAVPALRAVTPGWRSELGAAARQAVAEIQARLPGAAPGQLSLAPGEAGALSFAGEPGRLSFTGEETGRLSVLSEDGSEGEPAGPARSPAAQAS